MEQSYRERAQQLRYRNITAHDTGVILKPKLVTASGTSEQGESHATSSMTTIVHCPHQ